LALAIGLFFLRLRRPVQHTPQPQSGLGSTAEKPVMELHGNEICEIATREAEIHGNQIYEM